MNIAVVDLETVTLDAQPGSVWEVAVNLYSDTVFTTQMRPDLSIAQPKALEVGRFIERYDGPETRTQREACQWLCELFDGRDDPWTIAGSNPAFDIAHLDAMFRHDGYSQRWCYHGLDVPSMVVAIHGPPPPDRRLSLTWAAETAGVEVDLATRHTASGDVALTVDILRKLGVYEARHGFKPGNRTTERTTP